MNRKHNNFLQYLNDNYYDQLYKSLLFYIKRNKDELIVDKFDLIGVEDIEVEDLFMSSVYIDSKDDDWIEFDIQCNPEISYTEISGKHRTREASGTNKLWFTISCKARITNNMNNFYIMFVDEYNPNKPHKPLNGNLVPIIHHSDYEKYATEILNKFYPEAFVDDKPIDATILATRMGLNIIRRRIAKNKSIFGQIYYDETSVKLFNDEINDYEIISIPANTIIIDKTANLTYSYGCENITIAHECVHAYLHRNAFKFNRLFNDKLSTLISCTIKGEIRHVDASDDFSFIESQANGIAPCLLLPKEKLTRMYKRQLEAFINIGDSRFDAINVTIQELASRLCVTNYAIKKRLFDIGFDEVMGVYNWNGYKFIRGFGFKKGSLASNETYVIKDNDLMNLIANNTSNIIQILFNGQYEFVENHLVINDSKYLEYDKNGRLILSEYARYNLDECALKFIFKSQNHQNDNMAMFCYLSRDIQYALSMDLRLSSSKLALNDEVSSKFKKYQELMLEALKNIRVMSFGEAIEYLRKIQNLEIKEITDVPNDSSSLSARQFERYQNGETKNLNKRVVVAICLALKLPPNISSEVLKLAGICLTNSDEDTMLLTILMTCRNRTFDDINQMMITNGFQPLTNKRE